MAASAPVLPAAPSRVLTLPMPSVKCHRGRPLLSVPPEPEKGPVWPALCCVSINGFRLWNTSHYEPGALDAGAPRCHGVA
jgi:hypothetical protein